MFEFLDNLEITRPEKFAKLKKISIEKLNDLYSELIEKRQYYKSTDGVGTSIPKYPNALKIIVSEIDRRKYQGEHHIQQLNVRVKEEEEESVEDMNARYLRMKKEHEDKKRAAAKRNQTLESKRLLATIEEVLKSELQPTAKIKKIKRCLR